MSHFQDALRITTLVLAGSPVAVALTPWASSGTATGQAETNDQTNPEKEDAVDGDPVVQFTGNLQMEETDLTIQGRGMNVEIVRTYRNNSAVETPLGLGWDLNWFKRIVVEYVPDGGSVPCFGSTPVLSSLYYYDGATRIDRLTLSHWTPQGPMGDLPDGLFGKVRAIGDFSSGFLPDQFQIRFADGMTYTFTPGDTASPYVGGCSQTFWISEATDRHGNTISFQYEAVGVDPNPLYYKRLSRIFDTYGRGIDFTYGPTGKLVAIEDFGGRRVEYGYEGENLTTVRSPVVQGTSTGNDFPDGKMTTYQYHGLHTQCLTRIVAPQELMDAGGDAASAVPYLVNTYSSSGDRVVAQEFGGTNASGIAAGGRYLFLYDVPSSPVDHGWFVEARKTMSVSPNGNVTLRVFDTGANLVLEYRYTGRLNPESPEFADPETLLISTYLDMAWSSEAEARDPALNRLKVPHEPPMRPTDPESWVTIRAHNLHGQVVEEKAPGRHESYVYDTDSPDRFQQGNLLQRRVHAGTAGIPDLVESFVYEPLFNQVRAQVDPRGNDPSYTPPNGGAWSLDRYMNTVVFDYQEGDLETGDVNTLIEDWEIDLDQDSQFALLPGVETYLTPILQEDELGDVNGDGAIGQIRGNAIVNRAPTANVIDIPSAASPTPAFVAQASEEKLRFNDHSLLTLRQSAEGSLVRYRYHSNTDPTGQQGEPGSQTGGGLLAETESGDGQIVHYAYDVLGRLTQSVNGRGYLSSTEYNSLDQIVTATNALGHSTAIEYDGNDKQVSIRIDHEVPGIDPSSGWPGPLVDQGTVSHVFEYDILGNLLTADLDASDDSESVRAVTSYRYDKESNRVVTLKPEWNSGADPSNVESAVYDERNLLWIETRGGLIGGPAGYGTVGAHSDIVAEPAIGLIPDNPSPPAELVNVFHDYGANELEVRTTDGSGALWRFEYDAFNRLTKEVQPPVDGNADGHYRETVWGIAGNLVETRDMEFVDGASDRLLAHTITHHDERGRAFEIEHALNTAGVPPALVHEGTLTPGDGYATRRMVFDAEGREILRVRDDRSLSGTAYDSLSRVIRTWDNEGDSLGAGTWQSALSLEVIHVYDLEGNEIQQTRREFREDGTFDTFHRWHFFDAVNRATATVNGLGFTRRTAYDSLHNPVFKSDARSADQSTSYLAGLDGYSEHPTPPTMPINNHGNTVTYAYDSLNRLKRVEHAMRTGGSGEGNIDPSLAGDGFLRSEIQWDRNGRLVSRTDDNGHGATTQYDSLDRVASAIQADGTMVQAVSYDGNDRIIESMDANGSVVVNQYDPSGRLTSRAIVPGPGVHGTTGEQFEYDGLGRITRASNDDATITRTYDSLSNIVKESRGRATVFAKYDHDSRVMEAMYPGGRHLRYERDGVGRLKQVIDVGEGVPLTTHHHVGPVRWAQRELFPSTSSVILTRSFDGVGRILAIQTMGAEGSPLLDDRTFQWDRENNKIQRRNELSGVTHTYSYDSVRQLIQSVRTGAGRGKNRTISYTLDGAGNRVAVAGGASAGAYLMMPPDAPVNQYTHTPRQLCSYDNAGNLFETYAKQGPSIAQHPVQRGYDFRNLMVSHTNHQTGDQSVYRYDAFGRRTERIVAGQTTRYFHLGEHVIEERDEQGITLATYVYGDHIDDILVMSRGVNSYAYVTDDLGNVHRLIDPSGNLVDGEEYEYEDYGELLDESSFTVRPTGSSVGNPLFFTGRRLDSESGLYYFRARYFDPIAGRFTTRDPLGAWGDPDSYGNSYAYVGNNPWSHTDPTGLEKKKETPRERRKRIRNELKEKRDELKELRKEAKKNDASSLLLEELDALINAVDQLISLFDTYGSMLDDPEKTVRYRLGLDSYEEDFLEYAEDTVDWLDHTNSKFKSMTKAKQEYVKAGTADASSNYGRELNRFFLSVESNLFRVQLMTDSIVKPFREDIRNGANELLANLDAIPEGELREILDSFWVSVGMLEGINERWQSGHLHSTLHEAGFGLNDPANHESYLRGKNAGKTIQYTQVGLQISQFYVHLRK